MNRVLILCCCLIFLTGCSGKESTNYNDTYDPDAAVAYSYQYVEDRNPEYANFDSNCTNYISQALIAGGKQMDEAISPKKDTRIVYHNTPNRWFSTYIETNPKRWKEFSISNSFCRTNSFVEYWTEVRGMKLTTYTNTMDGLLSMYDNARKGDIILLYNEKEEIEHLCLLVVRDDMQLLVNANTTDYKDRNILDISAIAYPKIGLLSMK